MAAGAAAGGAVDDSAADDAPWKMYRALGLSDPKTTSAADIRRAYHQLARRLHPDKNPAPEAVAQFQRMQAAYAVLSDEKERALYDALGDAGYERVTRPGGSSSLALFQRTVWTMAKDLFFGAATAPFETLSVIAKTHALQFASRATPSPASSPSSSVWEAAASAVRSLMRRSPVSPAPPSAASPAATGAHGGVSSPAAAASTTADAPRSVRGVVRRHGVDALWSGELLRVAKGVVHGQVTGRMASQFGLSPQTCAWTALVVAYPLEVMQTVAQGQLAADETVYGLFRQLWRAGGVGALYAGVVPWMVQCAVLVRTAHWTETSSLVARVRYRIHQLFRAGREPNEAPLRELAAGITFTVLKVCAIWAVVTPIKTVAVRAQTASLRAAPGEALLGAPLELVREGGLKSLYAGIGSDIRYNLASMVVSGIASIFT